MRKYIFFIIFCLLLPTYLSAQSDRTYKTLEGRRTTRDLNRTGTELSDDDEDGQIINPFGRRDKDEESKKQEVPSGLRVWRADARFGVRDSVRIDTFSHHFQNSNFTEGIYGQYNTLGNMGSPRLSRLFAQRPVDFSYFIFSEPYDFFITPFSQLHFTNTLSPITNVTYHETLSSEDGEDRIRALYAINAGKDIGMALKLDYLYGRGYYDHQSTSDFNATLFGSILKEQYKAHFSFYSNYLKTGENGGIESDDYVTNPENFPSKYGTKDIPTRLSKVWNKMHVDGLQWTHRYSMGFHRPIVAAPDSVQPPVSADTTKTTADTARIVQTEFIPVTSIIHTLRVQSNTRRFMANEDLSDFYTNKYFAGDSTLDLISNTLVSNLVGVELHEGFNKWAMAGIRLYAQHDFNHYKMPAARRLDEKFTENRITLGGQLFKEQGRNINYTLGAETSSDGDSWGDFHLKGRAELKTKLLNDTVSLALRGDIVDRKPTFFYRNYHSHYLWWDNSLDKQMTTRIGATLQSKRTRTSLDFDLQNVKNYTYLASVATPVTDANGQTTGYTTDVSVHQESDNIQMLSLLLNQDFELGILNWENQVAYQTTTDKDVMPLPTVSLYTNLYLLFKIARVLRVEFGGDMRYFTSYYAPTYSPAIGLYTTQAPEERVKVGNYPIIDVYANFHLKHTRFYVMASHVNYSRSSTGSKFLTPHYPVNPFVIRLGLSWNFFN